MKLRDIFIKSKRAAYETAEPTKRAIKRKPVFKLVKEWNNDEARYDYRLYEGKHLIFDDGTTKRASMYLRFDIMPAGEAEYWFLRSEGDAAWAKKIKEHYKLEKIETVRGDEAEEL